MVIGPRREIDNDTGCGGNRRVQEQRSVTRDDDLAARSKDLTSPKLHKDMVTSLVQSQLHPMSLSRATIHVKVQPGSRSIILATIFNLYDPCSSCPKQRNWTWYEHIWSPLAQQPGSIRCLIQGTSFLTETDSTGLNFDQHAETVSSVP